MQPDTRKILRTGLYISATGIVAVLLTLFVFGGIGRQGPHSNLGWLFLMLAMGCLPTGTVTLLLAFTKLLGERRTGA